MAHDFKKFPELTNSQMQFYYLESPHKQITMDFDAKVIDVHDGDTIRVEWEERNFDFPIRILDIEAPELDETGGRESQSFMEDLLLNQDVRIEIEKNNRVGKWGRLLGRIRTLGLDVGQESMRNGHSIPFGSQ